MANDFTHCNFIWPLRQDIATSDSGHAFNPSLGLQIEHNLFKKSLRHVIPAGQFADRNGDSVVVVHESKKRPQGIIGLSRNTHINTIKLIVFRSRKLWWTPTSGRKCFNYQFRSIRAQLTLTVFQSACGKRMNPDAKFGHEHARLASTPSVGTKTFLNSSDRNESYGRTAA